MAARRVMVITGSRADWGPLRPVVRALADDPRTEPIVVAITAGETDEMNEHAAAIERDGHAVRRWPIGDGPISSQMARAAEVVGACHRELSPDVALILGDRYEALAASGAVVAEGGYLAHLHGGEITTGALDNQFRYAITALAHLHLVATVGARDRLIGMGRPEERVVVTGAPGLDGVIARAIDPKEPRASARGPGENDACRNPVAHAPGSFLLVTLHSETLGGDPAAQARTLVEALDAVGAPCLITASNADPGGEAINAVLRSACDQRETWTLETSLGVDRYRDAMTNAACMVGNSSSGIIEAASFGLRVVNIGTRQGGRERSGNVIDVAWDAHAIASAVRDTIAAGRWRGENVYGDGRAAERVVEALVSVELGGRVKQRAATSPQTNSRSTPRRP